MKEENEYTQELDGKKGEGEGDAVDRKLLLEVQIREQSTFWEALQARRDAMVKEEEEFEAKLAAETKIAEEAAKERKRRRRSRRKGDGRGEGFLPFIA